ncbi:MAG TPA: hypothetical protein VHU41_20400 [Thermoanaerobaculia bacterium]|jgi:hypothetical protein|nr:hypothetical protein [Thermoanaerobaculia bacterium]
MELRLAEIKYGEQAILSPRRSRRADMNVCDPRFLFVTYAVEIEGEAPLIFIAEAVDD